MKFNPNDPQIDEVDDVSSQDEDDEDAKIYFTWKKSNGSFNISNVQGITFGGIDTRYWLFRKHMNHISSKNYRVNKNDIPFYAWECLTIMLNNRNVHLVIRKESQMMMFIKFLVYRINSIDGMRDSGLVMEEALIRKAEK